ncbi:MAG: hypothetical protein H7A46_10280 [Verrucomicrobiales bacterium]|nr:hypothetical protein [Verrucomicrobiales bacterium]
MSSPQRIAILVPLLSVAFGAACGQAAMVIDGFTQATNDRFENDPAFIGIARDWSGVGMTDTATPRWLTMISPNVFLSATHYHPAGGASVTFYATNDPTGASVTRTVNSGEQIGISDLWIGTINAPLGVAYTYYEYATETIASSAQFASSVYYEEVAYMVGRSPTDYSAYPATQDMAMGNNMLDVWFPKESTGLDVDALGATRDNDGDANYQTYEAYLQSGDSGGPLFVEDAGAPGGLRLVGINWFNLSVGGPPSTYYNGFSYVGNYSTEIQAYLTANSVPEVPATGLLTGLLILAYGLRRRWIRASQKDA